MLNLKSIKKIAHRQELSHVDRILLCLATNEEPKKHKEIKETAEQAGLNHSILRNITAYLKKAKGLVLNTPSGWELTDDGWRKIDTQRCLNRSGSFTNAIDKSYSQVFSQNYSNNIDF